jgi:hypothetical protein
MTLDFEKAKKMLNGKIVDKGTKGRRGKTSNLFTRELIYFKIFKKVRLHFNY